MVNTKLVIAPALLPVTLTDAKAFLNIDSDIDADDALLTALLHSVTARAEQEMSRKIVSQTWKAFFNQFPDGVRLYLPFGCLQSVAHIKYTDKDSNVTEWAVENYIVNTDADPGYITLPDDGEWPDDELYPVNPVEVQFTCGYHHGPEWAAETVQAEGDIIIPATAAHTGLAYECSTAGVTDSEAPAYPLEIGDTVEDGTAVWTCKGQCIPEPIKTAIKVMLVNQYENREGPENLNMKTIPVAESMLMSYKIWRGAK